MKQKVLDYTVVIEKEVRSGTKIPCYTAYVPVLGIATEADTLDLVKKAIQEMMKFHLESLADEGEEIPVQKESSIITKLSTLLPRNAQIAAN